MSQGLARFHARSPRYILNTDDDCLIRVSGPQQIPWEEGTIIKNVSLTGLVFSAHEDLCPTLGEVIKLQFMAPGGHPMACHAIVTRLESTNPGEMAVAVHFYKVDMGHRIALAQGLSKKFREQLRREKAQTRTSLTERAPYIFLMMSALWLWSFLFYGMIAWGAAGLWQVFMLFFNGA